MADDNKTLELQIRIATQEAVKAISSLKGEIQTLTTEVKKFSDGAALEKSFKGAGAEAKESAKSIGEIKRAIGSLAEVVALTKALSVIKDMGSFALQTADNFQTMKNQFGTLLGDMEAGAGLFNEIKAFNDKTPFDMSTLTQATNVLIAAKVPLQDLQAQLTKFGDLSQGNSQKMTSYVNAFSQAAAKGKADMQVLNTYLHQGVPILDALAKNFGVTTAEIVEMSGEGKISFADFSKALNDLTAAGGQYFGGMELASKSLAAMQEGLREATNSLAASFGEMLMPAALGVTGLLTDLANAINEHPMLKGALAAVITAVTVAMGVMAVQAAALAVKTWLAQAAQMGLNTALAITNPALLVAIGAAAAATAGFVAYAASHQKSAQAAGDMAYQQKKLNDEIEKGRNAAHEYYLESKKWDFTEALKKLKEAEAKYNRNDAGTRDAVTTARQRLDELRKAFLKEFDVTSIDDKIKELQERIKEAKTYITVKTQYDVEISKEDKAALESIINDAQKEIDKLRDGISEEAKKRNEMIKELNDKEKQIQVNLSKTKIDNLEYEYQKELAEINKLEEQRKIAAAGSAEEIAKIQENYKEMRLHLYFNCEKDKFEAKLDEARDAVKNWQEELSDNLLIGIERLNVFSEEAAVILSDLSMQLIELASSATLSGFEEFGRALGEGEDAMDSMSRALYAMSTQILKQLPMMFLQAGLQLIANGQWPLGLGFIAAAGSTAIISGYVDGASKHAQGGVFDEYGQAAREFAAGGAFTNQIVSTPTYFAHGGGLGLMGEAGPEAIMPLSRMPNGDLGVQTAGSGASVIVNIINNSGAEVQQEETETADGGKRIDITIGEMINKHITSGKADRAMGRYGLRASGV